MKKTVFVGVLLVILSLSACGHTHVWSDATCTEAKFCAECGETEGEALGHSWIDATCEEPETCTVCGETKGEALGHKWTAATCTEPETCSVCGTVQGETLGHTVASWSIISEASCIETGLESGICSVCNETVERTIELKEHTLGDWVVTEMPTESTEGTRVKSCTVCGTEVEKESFSMSEEELETLYKGQCKNISYDSLSRTPDQYKGEYVKFTGKVVQVCSEASSALYYSTYRVATSGSYNNVVYIYVDNYGSGTRILEDDWITFYGEYDGLYSYTTVMGASVTIPSIKVKYVE